MKNRRWLLVGGWVFLVAANATGGARAQGFPGGGAAGGTVFGESSGYSAPGQLGPLGGAVSPFGESYSEEAQQAPTVDELGLPAQNTVPRSNGTALFSTNPSDAGYPASPGSGRGGRARPTTAPPTIAAPTFGGSNGDPTESFDVPGIGRHGGPF